jgi:hypothetical protein
MIFRPPKSRRLWDTWIFPWEDGYHLFFLEAQRPRRGLGHAFSRDLVHWELWPSIQTWGAPGVWNEFPLVLTGTTVHHEGTFYLYAGSNYKGVQVVGVFTSPDLVHWTPHPANPVMRPTAPHYQAEPAPGFFYDTVDWRDPCIIFDEADGYYHAFLCARLPQWSHADTGAAVAHTRSRDLIHWENLPPIATPGQDFYHTEVPDVFQMGDFHYVAFATNSLGGIRLDTATKDAAVGTFYLMSEAFEGPYVKPDDCLLVGYSNFQMVATVGRTIPYEGGRLLTHHVNSPRTAFGAPKRVRQRPDGTLWLEYFSALEKLETGVIREGFKGLRTDQPEGGVGAWDVGDKVVRADSKALGSAAVLPGYVGDAHVALELCSEGARRVGILFRYQQGLYCEGDAGVLVLDFEAGTLHIGTTKYDAFAGAGFCPQDSSRFPLERGRTYHLRIFLRDEHLEAYLDERWVFTTPMEMPTGGELALYAEGGRARFESIRVAAIEPIPEFSPCDEEER